MKSESEHKKFQVFFEKHYQKLCSIAYNYLKDKDASKDVAQEVFINIWNKRKDLVDDPKAIYYLITSVKNNCISILRKRVNHLSINEEEVINSIKIDTTASQEYNEIDIYVFIENALTELPPKCAIIFKMSRYKSMTYMQIAENLNISVKTVENQMGKAIKIMRNYIKTNPLPLFVLLVLNFLLKTR